MQRLAVTAVAWCGLAICTDLGGVAQAEPPPNPLDLEAAINFAAAHHPARRADAANERVASANIDLERARYLPDLELFAQLDRSSANAVPGALFPVPGLPVVGGVPGFFPDAGHWGTAAGVTASWDALGFTRWAPAIDRARAEHQLASDEAAASSLDIEYAAADRFIAAVAREEAVTAAKAGVDRAQVFMTIVKATVGSDLRSGADLSRAEAELAFAQIVQARAETARDVALAELREALDAPEAQLILARGHLDAPPPQQPAAKAARPDPHDVVAGDRKRVAEAQLREIERGTMPKLLLVGAAWGRGNGGLTGDQGIAYGLVPEIPNWALGVAFTWPLLAGRSVEPARRAQVARIDQETALADEVALRIASGNARARATLDGAYRVAQNTPTALRAARDAETQLTARYRAQLATADDVAQVQRLLVQAESDDALARLDVWRALLFASYTTGDLAPFLSLYRGVR